MPKFPFSPNSPFSPHSPTFWSPSSWVNLFALIISLTTFAIGHILPKSPLFSFSLTFWGPSSWVNLFALIISSKTLTRFRRHFRHCLHFWTYLMKENSPLKDVCPDKKLTNHSARKTVVKKLKSSGIPKCEIKNITGHSSEQGLGDYDSGDENEQTIMSNIIQNATNARQVLQPLSSVQTAPSQVYNFSHCNVTLNIAGSHSSQSSLSQSKRGYKRIFLPDSDSD